MNATPIMSAIHPGEVLLQEYLEPLGVTQHRLAVAIAVPPRRINEIVHGKRRISADTALRLARYFGTTERFWLNLQSRYDLTGAAVHCPHSASATGINSETRQASPLTAGASPVPLTSSG